LTDSHAYVYILLFTNTLLNCLYTIMIMITMTVTISMTITISMGRWW